MLSLLIIFDIVVHPCVKRLKEVFVGCMLILSGD
jgi:hypothetical protein